MGYIPGFEYDIFISYASANNTSLDEEQGKGWVTTTQGMLSRYLKTKVSPLSVWFDEKDITVGDNFEVIIKEGLEESATLLIFLSKAYLDSRWCKMERDSFLERLTRYREENKGGVQGHERVFIVRLENDLDEDEIPDELKGLHYKSFFKRSSDTGVPLCWPCPLDLKRGEDFTLYIEKINNLGLGISTQLKKLKKRMERAVTNQGPWSRPVPEQADTGGNRAFYHEKLQECDGLIIIYGEADERWVTSHLQRSYIVWKRGLRDRLYAAGAIVKAPPPKVKREVLSFTPPYMEEIDCREAFDEAWMKKFLETVKAAAKSQSQESGKNPFPCIFVHALEGKDREFARQICEMAKKEKVETCIPREDDL